MDLMEKLAENVVNTKYENLSESVIDAVKKGTLDIIGCMIAGVHETKKEADLLLDWGGKSEAPVYLWGKKLPLPSAVFLNSCTAYAIDYDAQITFHDLTATIPTALTIGDTLEHCSGKDFITAVAAGEDLASRLNDSANYKFRNWGDKYRLFCPGGTIVVFGVAATAAKMFGMDLDGMLNTLGLAYERCGTTDAPACEKSECVRIQMGITSRNGVEAALLAKAGIKGIKNVLEGPHGWYISFAQAEKDDDLDKSKITDKLGERYNMEKLHKFGLKALPVCGTTIPGLLAAKDLAEENSINYKKIKHITIETAAQGHSITGQPLTYTYGDEPDPAEGKFSQPYTVANAIIRRSCKLQDFTKEAMMDHDVIELALKVDPITSSTIRGKSARVTIEMEDGTIYQKQREASDNPFRSLDTVKDKFYEMLEFRSNGFSAEKAEQIVKTIDKLETLSHISELNKLIYSMQ